jgi:hypothetical protein
MPLKNYRIDAVKETRIGERRWVTHQIPLFILEGEVHGIISAIQAEVFALKMLREINSESDYYVSAVEVE